MYERICDSNTKNSIRAIENNVCNRCYSRNILKDVSGIDYCLECYQYFEITSENFLVRTKRVTEKIDNILEMNFKLSVDQIKGSNFLVNSYLKRKNAFLQAVCGAGKTEMCLALIQRVLNENKQLAFVIPRVEIIKQVSRRFKDYFPNTTISNLYNGVTLDQKANMIITTPQQLIKFYQEFDLVIIDEFDAYPLINNSFLERLIDKSKKNNAMTVYMSATITDKCINLIKTKKLEYHTISRRFHQKDLAIPKFIKNNNFFDKKILYLIKNYLNQNKQVIIYVASIAKGEYLYNQLSNIGIKTDLISSKTTYKLSIINSFTNSDLNILVSTTILERGVTFKNISVIVLEADSNIFNKSSLIQIAGRVGRIGDEGEVIFVGKYKSEAMIKAKKAIINFNRGKNEMSFM
ncbi:MAG: DEAD/DEAH box helicase [Candidatus Izemoplasmatales bacterium]